MFDVLEPPLERENFRPIRCEVPSLLEIEQRMIAAEIKYTRQRGLLPGQESLVCRDPAGNRVEITESSQIR